MKVPRHRFPSTKLGRWQKRISHRVFVDSEGLTLGWLTAELAAMWEDAQREMEESGTVSIATPFRDDGDHPNRPDKEERT